MSRAKTGRRARANGDAFERKVRLQLLEALGDDWSVERQRRHDQRGRTGHGGEFVIVPPDGCPPFPFAIECKRQASYSHAQLWTGTGPVFRDWWPQAVDQAAEVGRRPLLVWQAVSDAGRASGPILAALEHSALLALEVAGVRLRVGPMTIAPWGDILAALSSSTGIEIPPPPKDGSA